MSGLDAVTVLKIGGELIDSPARAEQIARAVSPLAAEAPLVIVHGGGREIDAECARRGIPKTAVDGLRVTDAATLEAVVAALAGTINTRLVNALVFAGLRAVGLTGADAACVRVEPAPPYRAANGTDVSLGLVGRPIYPQPPALIGDLLRLRYVPVLACLGTDGGGQLFNVNADTLAAHVAATCHATRLLITGATAGVLGADGTRVEMLDLREADALVHDGVATAGMVAKLEACRDAVLAGVPDVRILDGAAPGTLDPSRGTRIVPNRGAREEESAR